VTYPVVEMDVKRRERERTRNISEIFGPHLTSHSQPRNRIFISIANEMRLSIIFTFSTFTTRLKCTPNAENEGEICVKKYNLFLTPEREREGGRERERVE
jgi:hypothetical protein